MTADSAPPTACPDPARLSALIEGAVGGSERAAIEAHLGGCERCLARLDEAAGLNADWGSWDEMLGRPPVPTPPRLPGLWPVVPGYEILAELGRGGMGVVYQARQTSLNRIVAIKFLHACYIDDPEYVHRFRSEGRAVAGLRHPNIVPVYAVGHTDGRPYLVLEFVPGPSLREAIREGPWTAEAAAQVVGTLARAIQAAHDAGIVHRDLKTSNVLLDPDRPGPPPGESRHSQPSEFRPRLTDFGLASGSRRTPTSPDRAWWWGRSDTWRPSKSIRGWGHSPRGPTCTAWGRSCTSCSRAAPRSSRPAPPRR